MSRIRRQQHYDTGMKTSLSGEQAIMREDIERFIHMIRFNATRQGMPHPNSAAYKELMARMDVVKELESYIDMHW